MTEWYVIDTRYNKIVNCISTHDNHQPSLSRYTSSEYLVLDKNPPQELLDSYLYWNERP